MGGELHALLRDLAELCQGEDLKSARVGENGAIPIEKLVEAALSADEAVAGANVQMIGVGKLHLASHVVQVLGGDAALHGGGGAHVHEHGSFNVTVYGVEASAAGAALGLKNVKHDPTSFSCYVRSKRRFSSAKVRRNATGLP